MDPTTLLLLLMLFQGKKGKPIFPAPSGGGGGGGIPGFIGPVPTGGGAVKPAPTPFVHPTSSGHPATHPGGRPVNPREEGAAKLAALHHALSTAAKKAKGESRISGEAMPPGYFPSGGYVIGDAAAEDWPVWSHIEDDDGTIHRREPGPRGDRLISYKKRNGAES